MSKKPKLIPFRQVRIRIPRKYILRRYYSEELLTPKECQKISKFLKKIEKKIIKLQHVQSIVEQCLMKKENERFGYNIWK